MTGTAAIVAGWNARLAELEREPLPASIPALLSRQARDDPDRVLLDFFESGERLTRRELDRTSAALAAGMRARGIGPGDHVAIMLPNGPAWHPTWLAALRLGADGIKTLVYPWSAELPDSVADFTALALVCRSWGLPVMAEVIPFGFQADPALRTPAKLAAGARIAMEAGADVIKTFYTDPGGFAELRAYCPIPIVVLGGERAPDEAGVLASVRDALAAGAAGVAIGRNIWQHPRPGGMTAGLAALLHAGASVDEALALTRREGPLR